MPTLLCPETVTGTTKATKGDAVNASALEIAGARALLRTTTRRALTAHTHPVAPQRKPNSGSTLATGPCSRRSVTTAAGSRPTTWTPTTSASPYQSAASSRRGWAATPGRTTPEPTRTPTQRRGGRCTTTREGPPCMPRCTSAAAVGAPSAREMTQIFATTAVARGARLLATLAANRAI